MQALSHFYLAMTYRDHLAGLQNFTCTRSSGWVKLH